MKKAAVIALALILTCSLGACGSKEETTEQPASANVIYEESTSTAEADAGTTESAAEASDAAETAEEDLQAAGDDGAEDTDADGSGAATADTEAAEDGASGTAVGENGTEITAAVSGTAAGENATETAPAASEDISESIPSFRTTVHTEAAEKTAAETTAKTEPEDEEENSQKPKGLYQLVGVEDGKTVLDEEEIRRRETEGVTMYIRFAGDGVLTGDLFGQEVTGYWTEKSAVLGGSQMSYSVRGKELTLTDGGMVMKFLWIASNPDDKDGQVIITAADLAGEDETDVSAGETAAEMTADAAAGENGTDVAAEGAAAGENGTAAAAGENGTAAAGSGLEDLDGDGIPDSYGDTFTDLDYDGIPDDYEYGYADPAGSTGDAATEEAAAYEVSEETALDTSVVYKESSEYLLQRNSCSVQVTGFEPFAAEGFKIHVHCENNQYDDILFSIHDASVNNYMFDPAWSVVVPALDNLDSEIVFDTDRIRECGLTSFDDILMNFRLSYTHDWTEIALGRTEREIYPSETKDGEIRVPERKKTTQEKEIVDNEKFSFVVQETTDDPETGYTLHVYIENKTGVKQMFYWDDVKVNGILTDPFWAEELLPGTRTYTDITFPRETLSANGITAITGIEFTMGLFNNTNWLSYDMYTDTLKYRP